MKKRVQKRAHKRGAHMVADLLPRVLQRMDRAVAQKPEQVLASWPDLVGTSLAKMTRAVSFEHGIFRVHVTHSTLYSLLVEHEKGRLLALLRKKFPNAEIRDLMFRLG